MQIVTGAHVYTADNKEVGHVDRVVMDPRTNKVTHLVVRKGVLLKKDRVVPVDWVSAANGDHVALTPGKKSFKELPDFEEEHYIPAADAVTVAEGLGTLPDSKVAPAVAPALLWYPPAMGVYPGPGIAALSAPGGVRYAKTVEENIPENTVALKEGTKVLSSDGEDVGEVDKLVVNGDTKFVTHLIVKEGALFTTKKAIPAGWIGDANEKEIYLAVDFEAAVGFARLRRLGQPLLQTTPPPVRAAVIVRRGRRCAHRRPRLLFAAG